MSCSSNQLCTLLYPIHLFHGMLAAFDGPREPSELRHITKTYGDDLVEAKCQDQMRVFVAALYNPLEPRNVCYFRQLFDDLPVWDRWKRRNSREDESDAVQTREIICIMQFPNHGSENEILNVEPTVSVR